MTTAIETHDTAKGVSLGLRERLARWLYTDTGECDFCGEEIPADVEPITMTWKAGLMDVLLPNMAKLCSVECLACKMEVALGMPALAGTVLEDVGEALDEHLDEHEEDNERGE